METSHILVHFSFLWNNFNETKSVALFCCWLKSDFNFTKVTITGFQTLFSNNQGWLHKRFCSFVRFDPASHLAELSIE